VQNVNIVSAAPDLDRDGREDKYETMDVASAGTIRLEPYEASRGQVISDALAHLADPHSLAGQAAQRTLVTYTGANNARLIQGAVGQHTATAVQEAAEATANLVTQYRTQGMDDAAVLAAFQSGEAAAAIREATAAQDSPTPLTDAQLSAVADMVLLPQRRLTRTELVGVIGREAATGAADEQSVIQALGMPIGFGGQTGNVRGVMAGAQAMNLSPADLARLVEMIQDGLRDVVQAELADRGYRTEIVRHFVSDMAALPGAMVVPQSAAVKTIERLNRRCGCIGYRWRWGDGRFRATTSGRIGAFYDQETPASAEPVQLCHFVGRHGGDRHNAGARRRAESHAHCHYAYPWRRANGRAHRGRRTAARPF
jgi:hypothetical protein